MLHLRSSITILFILVAVVTAAVPYSEWKRAYQHGSNDHFTVKRQTAIRQALLETSACATITETRGEKSYKVRICTADPEDAPNNVCLGTRVNPCCSGSFANGTLVSSNQVNVSGEEVTVDYYLTEDSAAGVCFRLDDNHLSSETCSKSSLEDISCLPPCLNITTEPDCSSFQNNIYFLLDGTDQNTAFCTMGITIHMLTAAFNPNSSSSGTRLSTVLFPNGGVSNVVFNTSNTCNEIKSTLIALQTQMQTCQDIQQPDKSSITYTSLCGTDTTAVAGLDKIHSLIPQPAITDSAVVILTDGVIDDPPNERIRALNNLLDSNVRVQSIIAGGIIDSGATEANLRLYNRNNFANDGVVLAEDAVSLGIGIVRKMKEVGLICSEQANEVISALEEVQSDDNLRRIFCSCHNQRLVDLGANSDPPTQCVVGYPVCGGPLQISADIVPIGSP